MNHAHEILSVVFGIPMATGTISNVVGRLLEGLITTIQRIRDKDGGEDNLRIMSFVGTAF